MIKWRCGGCGKEYSTIFGLERVKAVETDKNPSEEHGYVGKCKCGYVFHKDRWYIQDTFKIYDYADIPLALIKVSTMFSELMSLSGDWYETMVFVEKSLIEPVKKRPVKCSYRMRYKTLEEATIGHETIINKLRNKEFQHIITENEIRIEIMEE